MIKFTDHGLYRAQNRLPKYSNIQLIIKYGTLYDAGNDCVAYFFGKKALKSLKQDRKDKSFIKRADKLTNTAVIISPDNWIVTVIRIKNIPRNWRYIS